jgi:diadenosine tetraphosphatase ApaH/serine/threonine PP2A family protein phosphatase
VTQFGDGAHSAVGRPQLPCDQRLYVIGDVHGRADLLDRLARSIELDRTGSRSSACTVFLGDYIDRGPKSAEVLGRLAMRDWPLPFLALRGNHEQMLLRFLNEPTYLKAWRHYGGLETLLSFGINAVKALDAAAFDDARRALEARLPPSVLDFVTSTPAHYELGDYYFCHAGIRPGLPLADQNDADLMWIREEFTNSNIQHEKIIVHGHTPVERPEIWSNRINIDTGAYITGVLTCLVLEGTSQRFLTA